MTDRDKVLEALYGAVDAFNEEAPAEQQLKKHPDTKLFTSGGVLDSMGLVHFIIAAEEALETAFSAPISLASESAMSLRRSPYRTLGSLADYAAQVLQEVQDRG